MQRLQLWIFCISFFIIFAAVHEGLADRRLRQFQSVRMGTPIIAATSLSLSRVSEPPNSLSTSRNLASSNVRSRPPLPSMLAIRSEACVPTGTASITPSPACRRATKDSADATHWLVSAPTDPGRCRVASGSAARPIDDVGRKHIPSGEAQHPAMDRPKDGVDVSVEAAGLIWPQAALRSSRSARLVYL